MQTLLKLCVIGGLLICVSGCGLLRPTRVVVIDAASDVVRLGPDVRGTIYLQAADGSWVKQGKAKLPEGWYAGPGPK